METLLPETERSESSSAFVAITAVCVLKDRCLSGDDCKASRRTCLAARCLGECWERRMRFGKHGRVREWGPHQE